MKHLYIIGNGFDIFTGLRTSYANFREWLQYSYPFIYEDLCATYEMDGEWWNDFETQLGKLDVKRYIKKFAAPPKSESEIKKMIEEKRSFAEKNGFPPAPLPCLYATRLRGLFDVLQYCFERWIEQTMSIIFSPHYTQIEKNDSYFINFNYTDVLQWLYSIKDEQILFIHGRASKHEHLVFGHNSYHLGTMMSYDEEQTAIELDHHHKNPYEHILKYDKLPSILEDVEYVHVYGFSISDIDEGYLDWIEMNTPQTSRWEFSWYSEKDKERIDQFVFNHWSLKNRYSLMQLQEISREEARADQKGEIERTISNRSPNHQL